MMEGVGTMIMNILGPITSWGGAFFSWRVKRNIDAEKIKEENLRSKTIDSGLRRDELLFQRRLDAALALWRAVIMQDRYVGALNILSFFKFEGLAETAMENEQMRNLLEELIPDSDRVLNFYQTKEAIEAEAIKFLLSCNAYRMYECRTNLITLPALRLKAMRAGMDARKIGDDDKIVSELCAFMPNIAKQVKELRHHSYSTAFMILKDLIEQCLRTDLLVDTASNQVVDTAARFDRLYQENKKQASFRKDKGES